MPFMFGMFQSSRISSGILRAACRQRRDAVLGLAGLEVKILEDPASDLADHAAVVDDKTMFHGALTLMRPRQSRGPTWIYGARLGPGG